MGPNRGPKLVHRFAADVRQKNGGVRNWGSRLGAQLGPAIWVPPFGSHDVGAHLVPR
jgi:hypothetical protein